jgi:hypothetical protein
LQLQGTPGFAGASKAVTPWAGLLYIAAAVPLLRLLAAPVAAGLFRLGEVCGVVLLQQCERCMETCSAALCAEVDLVAAAGCRDATVDMHDSSRMLHAACCSATVVRLHVYAPQLFFPHCCMY